MLRNSSLCKWKLINNQAVKKLKLQKMTDPTTQKMLLLKKANIPKLYNNHPMNNQVRTRSLPGTGAAMIGQPDTGR